MALWLIRAGTHGKFEDLALSKGLAIIGWIEIGNLSQVKTKEELYELVKNAYPDATPIVISNYTGQLWSFSKKIQEGDLVILPSKRKPVLYIGKVKGPYEYNRDIHPEGAHVRHVEWIKDVARKDVDQDLLFSFGSMLTVCQITRNNAEERIRAIVGERIKIEQPIEEIQEIPDIEQYAFDLIRNYISKKFRGHDLAHLVSAVLESQGYKVHTSPPGPDGGVDIICGRGPLGFDSPRMIVQVKSSDTEVDIKAVRELQGVMKNFNAEHGLFVSWGGFKSSVEKEKAQHYFEIRLWDSDDLIRAILDNYEKLPEEIQAELPLKRIWILVKEEEER